MPENSTFKCPNCGAPLDVPQDPIITSIECDYCGSDVIIPLELRPVQPFQSFQSIVIDLSDVSGGNSVSRVVHMGEGITINVPSARPTANTEEHSQKLGCGWWLLIVFITLVTIGSLVLAFIDVSSILP